jgi:hypothetical protein
MHACWESCLRSHVFLPVNAGTNFCSFCILLSGGPWPQHLSPDSQWMHLVPRASRLNRISQTFRGGDGGRARFAGNEPGFGRLSAHLSESVCIRSVQEHGALAHGVHLPRPACGAARSWLCQRSSSRKHPSPLYHGSFEGLIGASSKRDPCTVTWDLCC